MYVNVFGCVVLCCVKSWWEIVQAYAKGDNKSPLLRLRGSALTTLVQAMVCGAPLCHHFPSLCFVSHLLMLLVVGVLVVCSVMRAPNQRLKPMHSAQWRMVQS